MTIDANTSDGGGIVEVEVTEDGKVLLSWLAADGETFRWWKLHPEQADQLGSILKKNAEIAKSSASSQPPK